MFFRSFTVFNIAEKCVSYVKKKPVLVNVYIFLMARQHHLLNIFLVFYREAHILPLITLTKVFKIDYRALCIQGRTRKTLSKNVVRKQYHIPHAIF